MSTQIALTKKQRNKINRALNALEEVRAEVSEFWAEEKVGGINWYLEDNGNLCLMDGDSHGGINWSPRQDYAIDTFTFNQASGGGW